MASVKELLSPHNSTQQLPQSQHSAFIVFYMKKIHVRILRFWNFFFKITSLAIFCVFYYQQPLKQQQIDPSYDVDGVASRLCQWPPLTPSSFTASTTHTPSCHHSSYLLTLMLGESQVKFSSPQNISGASQQNSVAAFASTTVVVDGCLFEFFFFFFF